MTNKKWIKGAISRPGALHQKLGVAAGNKIPPSQIDAVIARLKKKAAGQKKLTSAELALLREASLAKTLRKMPKRGRK